MRGVPGPGSRGAGSRGPGSTFTPSPFLRSSHNDTIMTCPERNISQCILALKHSALGLCSLSTFKQAFAGQLQQIRKRNGLKNTFQLHIRFNFLWLILGILVKFFKRSSNDNGPILGSHRRVPPDGPTVGSHLMVPPEDPTLGSYPRVPP